MKLVSNNGWNIRYEVSAHAINVIKILCMKNDMQEQIEIKLMIVL